MKISLHAYFEEADWPLNKTLPRGAEFACGPLGDIVRQYSLKKSQVAHQLLNYKKERYLIMQVSLLLNPSDLVESAWRWRGSVAAGAGAAEDAAVGGGDPAAQRRIIFVDAATAAAAAIAALASAPIPAPVMYSRTPRGCGGVLNHCCTVIPDLDKTWDKTLITFFNFGITRFVS